MTPGTLAVLNCADGDTKLTFDKANPEEVERARTVVQDMLRRGYVISVITGEKSMERVTAFDPERDEYVLGPLEKKRRGRPPGSGRSSARTSAGTARAVAVAPTAGGGLCCPVLPIARSSSRRDEQ